MLRSTHRHAQELLGVLASPVAALGHGVNVLSHGLEAGVHAFELSVHAIEDGVHALEHGVHSLQQHAAATAVPMATVMALASGCAGAGAFERQTARGPGAHGHESAQLVEVGERTSPAPSCDRRWAGESDRFRIASTGDDDAHRRDPARAQGGHDVGALYWNRVGATGSGASPLPMASGGSDIQLRSALGSSRPFGY